MPLSFPYLLAAALAVSQVTSASPRPSPGTLNKAPSISARTWPTDEVHGAGSALNGILALAEIYSKYAVLMPMDLEAALNRKQKRGEFQVSTPALDICGNKLLLPTTIGRTGRNIFNLIVDTASADLWVHSKITANPKAFQAIYDARNSYSSWKVEDLTWEIQDPNGNTASGAVYYDYVTVNGLTVEDQIVQVAETAPRNFQSLATVSGVMGLAFSSRSTVKPKPQPSFFDRALPQLDENVFTVDMKHCSPGQVDFGLVDENAFNEYIRYTEVFNDQGYWNFTTHVLGALDINDMDNVELNENNAEYVIADTASDLIMLPMKYNSEYYRKIKDARYSQTYGGFVFPCASELPDFTFTSGTWKITITGRYLKHSRVNDKSDICFGGLQPSNNLGLNVIGSPAFKSTFVVFDPVKKVIGWVEKDLWDESPNW